MHSCVQIQDYKDFLNLNVASIGSAVKSMHKQPLDLSLPKHFKQNNKPCFKFKVLFESFCERCYGFVNFDIVIHAILTCKLFLVKIYLIIIKYFQVSLH